MNALNVQSPFCAESSLGCRALQTRRPAAEMVGWVRISELGMKARASTKKLNSSAHPILGAWAKVGWGLKQIESRHRPVSCLLTLDS